MKMLMVDLEWILNWFYPITLILKSKNQIIDFKSII